MEYLFVEIFYRLLSEGHLVVGIVSTSFEVVYLVSYFNRVVNHNLELKIAILELKITI